MCRVIPEEELEGIGKILIIQYKPFGDVLLNTAYLPALRARFPRARIDYLVQPPYTTLLKDNPNLDHLVIMERHKKGTLRYALSRFHLIRKIQRTKYDVIIDQARGPGASQITLFSGARYRIGWLKTKKLSWLKGYNWVYNYRMKKDHEIYSARAKFQLLAPLGIKEEPHNTFYHILPESVEKMETWLAQTGLSTREFAVFSPVTPIKSRQWRLELFARTADIIHDRFGHGIVLLWGPGEKDRIEEMASMMRHIPFIATATTFNEAGALLRKAAVYLGNNGGIHHLAVAMGTPTLTVFGPGTKPRKWTAWHQRIHDYIISDTRKKYIDGTFGITPEEVVRKLERLMENIGSI